MSSATVEKSVNLATVFDQLPTTVPQYLIFTICFVLNMLDGMDVVLLSYTASDIGAEFGVVKSQMGAVFSLGLVGMALGGLVLGAYADRIGRKKIILAGLIVIAFSVGASSFASSITELAIWRLVTGLGIGGLLACVTAVTSEFAPADIRNKAVMIVTSGYPLGALITGNCLFLGSSRVWMA